MGLEKGCPCCKLYKDGLEFKTVMELEKAGLVIYRHTTPVNSVASVSQQEKAFNTKDNVFIIHNTRNRNVSTSNYMSEFEQAIHCPRCKYIVKHTMKLLLNIPFIRKKDVIGICDHCRYTKRNNERCNKCQVFVEQFVRKQEQRQTETRFDEHEKVKLSKIEHILKDAPKAVFAKSKTKTRSETSLKDISLSYTKTPTYHVPRVKDMFDVQMKPEKNKQQLKKGFLKLIEPTKLYSNKSDSEITFIESKRRKEYETRKKILFNSTEDIAGPRSLRESGESLKESVESFKESAEFIGLDSKYHHGLKQKPKLEADTIKQQRQQPPSTELDEYLKKEHDIVSPVDYRTKKWPSKKSDIHEKDIIKTVRKYQQSYDDSRQSQYDQKVSKSSQKKEERGMQKTEEENFLRGIQKKEEEKFFREIQKKEEQQFLRGIQKIEDENLLRGIQKKEEEKFLRGIQKTEDEHFLRGIQKKEEEKFFREIQKKEEQQFLRGIQKIEDENLLRGIQKKEEEKFLRGIQKTEDEHFLRGIQKKEEEKNLRGVQKTEDEHFLRGIQKKEENFLRGKKESRSDIRRYSSEETLLKSASETTGHKLHKDFSYFFIKETDDVKKPPRKRVSSAELIKDTQDMYRARAEEERLKKEQELKEKLEAEEKKRLAKIERKKFLEEERRLEELKRKKAEEEKRKLKQIEEKKDLHKEKPSKQDIESQEKSVKTSKEPSVKSKSIILKPEIKESKIDKSLKSERDSQKSKKDLNKQDKEELMRLKKEGKLKEKSEKEEQMRQANELKQRQKEEKDKEKRNKEEQMRIDKEEKQRQKEEKEKEKANKEEQMRKAKEEKQREKEEKEQKQREKERKLKEKEERQRQKEEYQRLKEEEEKENEEKYKQELLEQKLLADAEKEKDTKLKKEQEENEKKQEEQLKLKSLKEAKPEEEPEKPQSKQLEEESKMKDLNINQIKVRKDSPDDLILQLVKLKQTRARLKERPTRLSQINVPRKVVGEHKGHKNIKPDNCIICLDSDLELDIENIRFNETKPKEINDVIVGQKIIKHKHPLVTKKEDKDIKPLFFSSTLTEDENIIKTDKKPPIISAKYVEHEVPKGVIRYALSDRTFIEKGWTMLPTEKVVRKMNVYRMRPAHPEFDWFEHNKSKKLISYDTGEKLAEFDDNGKGRWFYRSGKVALDYYDAEEINAQQRIVIFSSGEPDERGSSRPFAILATFDYLGNGIVFDHAGKIRLKYNQTEGVVLDRSIGPVSHWKWHTLNDPPVLQQVMIDTQMAHKDPDILKLGGPHDDKPRPDNEEMLAIEFDNFIKEKSKKLSQKFKPFQIKMKALKINEHFSLKVLDQATIYLIYRDGSTNLKLNIGMILDHQEIVDTDTAEVGEVSNSLQRFPARTDSLAGLQRSVAYAQRVERARAERSQRLRPAQPTASVDRLAAGLSRPRPAPPDHASCPCRKPPTFNLYYDTRLI